MNSQKLDDMMEKYMCGPLWRSIMAKIKDTMLSILVV